MCYIGRMQKPEYSSIESFAQYLIDEDKSTFTHEDLTYLNFFLNITTKQIKKELESYGFKLAERKVVKYIRGFTSSSNDRWFGPGSSPTHGGAAYDKMMIKKYGKVW